MEKDMTLGIGIDTGGTYTDSVIVTLSTGEVLSKAKALTTPADLGKGIRASLEQLDPDLFERVTLTALSTTLATNSVVENRGSAVGLIMAVPSPETFDLPQDLPCEASALIAGSHTLKGEEQVSLDLAGARNAIQRMDPDVDAFALSGYFSIYNAGHELALARTVSDLTGKPVVCAHELSGAVGMLERAVTAILNARLLPVIRELTGAVETILTDLGIAAPLMVVKGDGALMNLSACRQRPVETVLSGPAASISGACRLSGLDDAVVLDMGGTTTDIAVVRGGRAKVSKEGARVGEWQTRVRAVDMWTLGLGGDSRITIDENGGVSLGPDRVLPLSRAGGIEPGLAGQLRELTSLPPAKIKAVFHKFFTLRKRPAAALSDSEERLMERLDGHILSLEEIRTEISSFLDIRGLVRQGVLLEAGFTPTDLLHAEDGWNLWDSGTAHAALDLLAHLSKTSPEEMKTRIREGFNRTVSLHLAAKCLLETEAFSSGIKNGDLEFLRRMMGLGKDMVALDMSMVPSLVAVGAPVQAHMPGAAAQLSAALVVPPHAEVANAYGAVTGKVVETATVVIRPASPEGYALAAPGLQRHFFNLDEAVTAADAHAKEEAARLVTARGGSDPEIDLVHDRMTAPLAEGWGEPLLIELKVTATASGAPASSPLPVPPTS